jgi:two-component system sensor histidine kinase AlgZ
MNARMPARPAAPASQARATVSLLPDFCQARRVLAVMVIAELFAFVLALAPRPAPTDPWAELALLTLYIQWQALTCCALLCLARRWLARLSETAAALAAYALVVVACLLLGEAAWQALHHAGGGLFDPGDHPAFVARNALLAAIVAALALRYLHVRHAWQRRVEGEAEARVEVLTARIRPHFLFNSMNTIAALIRERPESAERAVEDLSDLFRASLNTGSGMSTLAAELELARRYLALEALRLGPKLAVEWSLDGLPEALRLPPLTLQPLVENAVYHGIEPRTGGGVIRIGGHATDDGIELIITNPLPAMAGHAHGTGNNMALATLRARLAALYGARARLDSQQHDGVFSVRLFIPGAIPRPDAAA